jgi:hypothetical protein
MISKVCSIIGCSLAVIYLGGLALTLTGSPIINFTLALPVWIVMGIAFAMMAYDLYENFKK